MQLQSQVRDQWGFQMTARYEMYAKLLQDYIQPEFCPQVIRESQWYQISSIPCVLLHMWLCAPNVGFDLLNPVAYSHWTLHTKCLQWPHDWAISALLLLSDTVCICTSVMRTTALVVWAWSFLHAACCHNAMAQLVPKPCECLYIYICVTDYWPHPESLGFLRLCQTLSSSR